MAELKFVLKSLFITTVVIAALQFDISGVKMEKSVTDYLRHGAVVRWVRDSVKGGHQFLLSEFKNTSSYLKVGTFWPKSSPHEIKQKNVSSDIEPDGHVEQFPDSEVNENIASDASLF